MPGWIESLDVQKYVENMMKKEEALIDKRMKPKIDELVRQRRDLKVEVSDYGKINNLLQAFQQSIAAIASSGFSSSYNVASSNPAAVTASVSEGVQAFPGAHNISNVTTLAAATEIASTFPGQGSPITNPTTQLGISETMNFTVGSNTMSVTILATDTLESISTKINSAAATMGVGVTSTYYPNSSGQYELYVSSAQTGVANGFSVTESPSSGNIVGLSNVMQAAQDAQFTFDNTSMTSPTNALTLDGIDIMLLQTNTTTTTSIMVTGSPQTSNALTAIQNFVTAYNAVMTQITQAQADNSGNPDQYIALISNTLQSAMGASYQGGGLYSTLASIGITQQSTVQPIVVTLEDGTSVDYYPSGLLTINTDPTQGPTLSDAINNNFAAVQTMLLNNYNQPTLQPTGLLSIVNNMLNPTPVSQESQPGNVQGLITGQWKTGSTSINSQVTDLDEEIKSEQETMKITKKKLADKYGHLEILLNKMKFTSEYLNQQLQLNK
ncbi:MAG: flagellar filament capping protein FliD [Gammaproteobacteria bacterium]